MTRQILNRPWGPLTMLRLGLCALSIASLHVMAAPPAMKTIGQLYREENNGEDPDRMMNGGIWGRVIAMDKGIPRDFPVPASSRDLKASGVMPIASVTGTMALAEDFYTEILPLKGWHIYRRIKVPSQVHGGVFSIVACQVSQCVTLNANPNDHGDADASDDEDDSSDDEDDLDENDKAAHKEAIALDKGRRDPPTISFNFYKKEGADPSIFQKRRGEK
ncbi:MAG: hypothetical protein CVU30_06555 [Betaproteobacteria bacterium HGW-Betaproteobacteria-3]|nr:MAG: hypothetical protein CVU30_06555 [Betaproteobacteria bacterium HGW-Betaproteobacteria-3]